MHLEGCFEAEILAQWAARFNAPMPRPMERLFQADLEDGTLDAYAGSGIAMEGIALAKTMAHWIATGIPLALIAPILWIMLQGPPEQVMFVIGAALVINLVAAALAGATLPLILKRMKIDPALAGSVILTTITDVVGFFSFLGLAAIFYA